MNKIEKYVVEAEYSAYGIYKILNQILIENGSKEIRPQMMYNYARNGLIVRGEKIFGATLRKITNQEVKSFISRYCARNEINIDAEPMKRNVPDAPIVESIEA